MFSSVRVRPIESEEERLKIYEEAANDGGRHPLMPTHVILKNGEIAGAFCVTSPTVYWWAHTEKIKPRDSLMLWQSLDTVMSENGFDSYVLPCEPESPYFKLLDERLPRFQGTEGGDWRLFVNTNTRET